MKFNRTPDNHDERLKYYELVMERKDTRNISEYVLPKGFRFVFYQPGDKKDWIAIEMSAREFVLEEEGEFSWAQYYEGKEKELENRMIFIETAEGEKVATATAFYEPGNASGAGWLHWVAVKREYQGKGLAKPLISYTLHHLAKLGYTVLKVPTQTTTWVAVKIYMDFGFAPVPVNAVHSKEGYQIMRTLTNHPCLQSFEPMPYEDIWDIEMVQIWEEIKEQIPDLQYCCQRMWEGQKMVLYCSETERGKWKVN